MVEDKQNSFTAEEARLGVRMFLRAQRRLVQDGGSSVIWGGCYLSLLEKFAVGELEFKPEMLNGVVGEILQSHRRFQATSSGEEKR